MPTKKWFVQENSWKGPGEQFWRVLDHSKDLDLDADQSNGLLTAITLPIQGNGSPVIYPRVHLKYQISAGVYWGSVHDEHMHLLVLLEVRDSVPRAMSGILYSLKDGPVRGWTDPEPIGIWGAEERDGNQWTPQT
ncbi:MAG TPA: hypothetical protein VMW27_07180 [Thermoanaerobaculia bacterium]|nr:hypothetical protein [Thermoanaerobaculia bacterium]